VLGISKDGQHFAIGFLLPSILTTMNLRIMPYTYTYWTAGDASDCG